MLPTGNITSHTLTTAEMPSHGHNPANEPGYYGFITNSQKAFTIGDMGSQSGSGRYYPYAAAAFDISRNTLTGTTGGGNSHNNMPPYLAVYVWKRTA
jgi:microcystin-dependent protein